MKRGWKSKMIIKYNNRIYATCNEDCYMDSEVQDICFLLGTMAYNGDIRTYTTKHYVVDGCDIGEEDDNREALDNLLEMYERDNTIVPIEVIKE